MPVIVNGLVDTSALCMSNLLLGDARYAVGAMYFEFRNLANPSDDPAPPVFDKTVGIEYYMGLQYSYDRDFIRVPVIASNQVSVTEDGNYLVSYYAVTPGDDNGFWGKSFDALSNSVVYGGALVATVSPSQQSQDVLIARAYPTGTKVAKVDGEQIAMTWSLEIVKPTA